MNTDTVNKIWRQPQWFQRLGDLIAWGIKVCVFCYLCWRQFCNSQVYLARVVPWLAVYAFIDSNTSTGWTRSWIRFLFYYLFLNSAAYCHFFYHIVLRFKVFRHCREFTRVLVWSQLTFLRELGLAVCIWRSFSWKVTIVSVSGIWHYFGRVLMFESLGLVNARKNIIVLMDWWGRVRYYGWLFDRPNRVYSNTSFAFTPQTLVTKRICFFCNSIQIKLSSNIHRIHPIL
jgi:hypothetical protein